MQDLLGGYHIKDALTQELLIVAYDYNGQEPRFFSKWFAKEYEEYYDVTIGAATGASSAAPGFFAPKVNKDKFGVKEMQIDGGIISNNPAFYAYQMATNFYKAKDVRVLSLGTGEKPYTKI